MKNVLNLSQASDSTSERTRVSRFPLQHHAGAQHVPARRKEGVAAQERPTEQLLDPETDWNAPQARGRSAKGGRRRGKRVR